MSLVPSAGVKCIAGGVYQEMRQTLVSFVTGVVHDAITVAEHCRRMTITVNDMLLVLKRRNMWDICARCSGLHRHNGRHCLDCLCSLCPATCRLPTHAWHSRNLVLQLCPNLARSSQFCRDWNNLTLLPVVAQHGVRLWHGAPDEAPDIASRAPTAPRAMPRGHRGAPNNIDLTKDPCHCASGGPCSYRSRQISV